MFYIAVKEGKEWRFWRKDGVVASLNREEVEEYLEIAIDVYGPRNVMLLQAVGFTTEISVEIKT